MIKRQRALLKSSGNGIVSACPVRNPLPEARAVVPPWRERLISNGVKMHQCLVTAYIGLGSNLGHRRNNLLKAIRLINQIEGVRVVKKSHFFLTAPVGFSRQPDFLNAVIEIETTLSALDLLKRLLRLERMLGRVRQQKWGPRIIDLDILLYGQETIFQENLIIPHPEMAERRFVLEPLAEIAPNLRHPVLGKTIKELLQQCKSFAVCPK